MQERKWLVSLIISAISHFRSSSSEGPTGCDDLSVAADRQRHEDQEYSSPRAHCKCNGPGTFCVSVSVSVLILAMIQDQALVASKRSKHYLVGKKEKSPGHKKVGGSFKMDFILQIQFPSS